MIRDSKKSNKLWKKMEATICWIALVMAVTGMRALSGRGSGSQNESPETFWHRHSFWVLCSQQDLREEQSGGASVLDGQASFKADEI